MAEARTLSGNVSTVDVFTVDVSTVDVAADVSVAVAVADTGAGSTAAGSCVPFPPRHPVRTTITNAMNKR